MLDSDKQAQETANTIERELNERLEPITQKLKNLETLKKDLEATQAQNKDITEIKTQIQRNHPDLYTEL
jgi:hypothetical protein